MSFDYYRGYCRRPLGTLFLLLLFQREELLIKGQGLNTPQDSGLWSSTQIPGLKRVVDIIHSQSQHVAIQLQHAGRKSSICPPWLGLKLVPESQGGFSSKVKAPSAEAWNENYATPSAMSEEEIWEVIEGFGKAAKRAVEAGVDVVTVHGAHGYLIHEFASPAVSKNVHFFSFSLRSPFFVLLTPFSHPQFCPHSPTTAPTPGAAPSKTAYVSA